VVILAGYERSYSNNSPSVWGHKSAISINPQNWKVDGVNVGKSNGGAGGYAMFGEIHLNHFATIGIMAHELGHLAYALPDLYDTDGSSNGISIYGLMGAGSWGARLSGGEYAGQTPVPPSAWSRYILGWVDDVHPIGTTDIYNAAHASATEVNTIIRASSISDPDEYFLAEIKRPTGYNEGLERWLGSNYSGGVMIWHVDDSQTDNTDDTHRWVDVEWADGNQNNLSNDFWLNGGNSVFTISSTPNSLLYSFADSGVEIYVNSSAADIMSVTFGPPNTAPNVTISTPADNANFTDSDVIAFTGSASDAEDGDLSASIEWSSDIDGVLGSGASVNTTLTAGTHTISATVTDSGTLVDIDNITVNSYGDSDADGMNDLWEINYFGSIAAEDGAGDFDGDGLYNLDEFNLGTTPTDTDTDSDGVSDGDEVALYNIDPLQSNIGDIAPLGSPDGQINAGDLVVMTRLVTGAEEPTVLESALADINGDSQLNAADLLLLQKAVLAGTTP